MSKRKYAVLTKAQGKIVTSLIKKGYSQKYAAKKIKIAKKSVSIFVKKKKIGKRVASPFWHDVKVVKEGLGMSHRDATTTVRGSPKWVNKRWNRMAAWRRRLATAPVGRGEKGGYSPKETIQKRFMEARNLHTQNEFRMAWEANES